MSRFNVLCPLNISLSKSSNPTSRDSDNWVTPVWWAAALGMKVISPRSRTSCNTWFQEGGVTRPAAPSSSHCTPPQMWGLHVPCRVCFSVQGFSRKWRCVAAIQAAGDPGVPLLESIQVPPGLRRGEYPGVTAASVFCCFPAWALLPAPERSQVGTTIIPSGSVMCRGQRLSGEAVEGFVHLFRIIRKIGQENSSHASPMEDLTT